MSRRDTIIIAALLNAGLLIVLFATSLKTETVGVEREALAVASEVKPSETLSQVAALPTPASPSQAGESSVEEAIRKYAAPQIASAPQEIPTPATFASELQGLGLAAEVASTQAPSVSEPSFKEVKVKKGDVLERIARRHNVTVNEIMKANGMTTTRLKIGQTLKIPAKAQVKAVPSSEGSLSLEEGSYYTVKPGDNPWTIAIKNHLKVEELLRLNDLTEEKARKLKPGDKLRVK